MNTPAENPAKEISITVKLTVKITSDDWVTQETLDKAVERDLEGIKSEVAKSLRLGDDFDGYVDDNDRYYLDDLVSAEVVEPYEF
jgi:hypothetical protein